MATLVIFVHFYSVKLKHIDTTYTSVVKEHGYSRHICTFLYRQAKTCLDIRKYSKYKIATLMGDCVHRFGSVHNSVPDEGTGQDFTS